MQGERRGRFATALVAVAVATLATATACLAQGVTHRVTKDDVCWENVAAGDSERWDLTQGTEVTFIADQGSYVRIRTANGIECSIASDSVEEI